jgi:hypothetical protein
MKRRNGRRCRAGVDEVIDRLEAGQSPEEIDAALPDMGAGSEFGGDDFE